MRAVVVFLYGLLTISAITLMAGTLLEPILEVVTASQAVADLGWSSDAVSITDTILRYMPLMFIAYLLAFAGAWAFRRERFTDVRRR